MLLLKVGEVDVDVAVALRGYEDALFQRAQSYEVEPGKHLNICSAEDLIIHKALAGRPQDITDIEGVIDRQRDSLDIQYIRSWLAEFSNALADTEILDRFERSVRK